jgi:hypothetical protein
MSFILIFWQSASATPVTILSSEHHVWGNIDGTINEVSDFEIVSSQSIHREYDLTSSAATVGSVDAHDFGFIGAPITTSNADLFSLEAETASMSSWGTVGSREYEFNANGNSNSENDACAQGIWTFQTAENNLSVAFLYNPGPYSTLNVWLTDLTTGSELLYGDLSLPGENLDTTILTDINHVYELKMYIKAESAGDVDSASLDANLYSTPVPEPETFALLFLSIIGGVAAKFKYSKNC